MVCQNRFGVLVFYFGRQVNSPPILEPILVVGQNRLGVFLEFPFWSAGEFTTQFRADFGDGRAMDFWLAGEFTTHFRTDFLVVGQNRFGVLVLYFGWQIHHPF